MELKIAFFFIFLPFLKFSKSCEDTPKVICYVASWAYYRPEKGQFRMSNIEPRYCTHVVYAFAGLSIDGEMTELDPQLDKGYDTGYKEVLALKNINPCLKVLISIGGWSEGSEKFSLLADDAERREKFVDQALRFVVHYGFDGVDFDWEYPTMRGGLPQDKQNFITLLTQLKSSLAKRNKMLTVAVSGSIFTAEEAYEVPSLCKIVEHLHVMSYDQHVRELTSYHSPLYPNLNDSIHFYLNKGCPAEKIILGIPSYGRSFTLQDPQKHELGARAVAVGAPGPYTRESGYLGFNEICEAVTARGSDWKEIYDKKHGSYYAYKGIQWVSYDSHDSVIQKVEYVQNMKLGGVLFWTLDTDDFRATCYQQRFPLLEIASYMLLGVDIKDEL